MKHQKVSKYYDQHCSLNIIPGSKQTKEEKIKENMKKINSEKNKTKQKKQTPKINKLDLYFEKLKACVCYFLFFHQKIAPQKL